MVLDIGPGKERFPKGHGFVQSVDLLSSAEADHPADAGLPPSAGLYQRTDEREYDDLVCCYGLVERPAPSQEE